MSPNTLPNEDPHANEEPTVFCLSDFFVVVLNQDTESWKRTPDVSLTLATRNYICIYKPCKSVFFRFEIIINVLVIALSASFE